MFLQILKNDMVKRKGVNIILFLFITLATVFLCSSVNNIVVVTSAIDYYMDYANIPDVNIIMNQHTNKQEIDNFMEREKTEGNLVTYDYNNLLSISGKSVKHKQQNKLKELESVRGVSLYIGKQDVDYNKVFDQQGNPITLEKGEVALCHSLMETNHLEVGDVLVIQRGTEQKQYTIKVATKDAAFGNGMVGMQRLLVSKADYHDMAPDYNKMGLYYVDTKDISSFTKAFHNQGFDNVLTSVTKSTYQMIYSFDMIMAGLLILIGICLILIALLVLRFTLVFTMEEQYQEIGVLKAIGLRNLNIKKLYLIKYLVIVLVGAALGLVVSVPISGLMIDSVSKNMIMERSGSNLGVNIACAVGIILLVLLFCYFCTRKLNQISAVSAIRGGSDGKRFHKQSSLKLSSHKQMRVYMFLGINDMFTHLKRYLVLIITFTISFILITIPLNTLNTIGSKEMVNKFALNPDSAVYVRDIELPEEDLYTNITELEQGVKRIKLELKEKGYNADLTAIPFFFLKMSNNEKGEKASQSIMTLQLSGGDIDYLEYDEGTAPILENEIAVSSSIMEENAWKIGDYIKVTINGAAHHMLITGSYSDYMQLGKSARLNPVIRCDKEILFDYWSVMVNMKTDQSQTDLAAEFGKTFPDYEWVDAQTLVDQNVGGIQETLKQLVTPMTGMLCLIIMLITLLMGKLFIAREKGEIAIMKSMGFSYRTIQKWQLVRMLVVTLVSMVIAVPLSLLSNQFILKPIFAIMGAQVTIQVDPLRVYLLYPGMLLFGIMIATLGATRGIRHIDIRQMNNLE